MGGYSLHLELLEDRWTPTTPASIEVFRANRVLDAATGLAYTMPTPARPIVSGSGAFEGGDAPTRSVPSPSPLFDGLDIDSSAALTGTQYIPAGPSGAVGPNHVVGAVNAAIRWSSKTGTGAVDKKLGNAGGIAGAFFDLPGTSLDPTTPLYDPKVIFDQYANRFVVTAMEQSTVGSNSSFIFVAVSQTTDPNGVWNFARINSKVVISSVETYADSPGLAVDNQAIYISSNQFSFGDSFLGNRLFVLPKGIGTGGIYDAGGASTPLTLNPVGSVGAPIMTYAPAHMFGAAPSSVGTWLVAYSAMSDGIDEYLGVIRVDTPLGTPAFNYQLLNVGNIDNTSIALPQATQSGTATLLDTGNDSALQAVWRDNNLYATTTVVPASGADVNQATAHWWRLNTTTLASLATADQANIGGNDIAPATHTFFPSIAVDAVGNVAFGFAASAPTIFPGAYYTGRENGDSAGTNQGSTVLRAGQAFYVQTLGTGANRWGGYSTAAIDPNDNSFWLFNQYAKTQAPSGTERGRWGTTWGRFQFDQVGPTVVQVGPVTPDPRNVAVSTVDVTFSELIRIDTFDVADISLTRNGFNVAFSGNETFQFLSGFTYRIGGLSEETNPAGNYVLTVNATGIKDGGGNDGTGSAADSFVVDKTPPIVLQVGPVSPDPRNAVVAAIDVVFSEPINVATFTNADLTLTLDGNNIVFSGNESVALVSGNTYRVSGLGEETASEGAYLLIVDTKFIEDLAGNADSTTASDDWVMDRTDPEILELDSVSPDPRNTPVPAIGIKFSEAIAPASFTFADITLLRNGSPVGFSGNESIGQVDAQTFSINGIAEETALAGSYTITVNMAAISDLAGNNGSASASDTWVMDTAAPGVAGVFFDGSTWTAAFRTAVGSSSGFPAQTGAGQLQSMPWNNVNVIRIKFSENVSVQSGDIGIRGINVPNYAISSFSYNSSTLIASWTLTAGIDTDRVLIDLDGNLGTAVADPAGNKLAGTWTEGVSGFPSTGAPGVDFKFRFVIAVGDGNRDGVVRNADLNLVRNNLFIDLGTGGYSVFLDVDGNGQTRNADLNATRNHLFVDPPAGPGPFGAARAAGNASASIPNTKPRQVDFHGLSAVSTPTERESLPVAHRRLGSLVATAALDELFASM